MKGHKSIPNNSENFCCTYTNVNRSCSSLYSALANLISNVLINITTDMKLLSVVTLYDLANVTIIGHNNPTINCDNSGGVHFMNCSHCVIDGITWEGCGARNNIGNNDPVLKFFNSSNTVIKNCSFQHSIGQAVVLSEVSGDVSIAYCKFASNEQYEGHGKAIHYSSINIPLTPSLSFTITNCKFLYNKRAKSVVYFGQSSAKVYAHLKNCNFYHNTAVPVYLTYQNLYISGSNAFFKNTAENGGGIFISNYSNVTFHKGATVNFTSNTAKSNGGAIFITNHSSIIFKDHLIDNQLYDYWNYQLKYFEPVTGTLCINSCSTATYEGNSTVKFNNNSAKHGGALCIKDSSVTFKGNSTVTFNNNNADYGGAVYIKDSNVTFEGNSTVALNNNNADIDGGALDIFYYSTVTFKENSKVTFSNNNANYGGAVHIRQYCNVTFEGNSRVTFNNNNADIIGGALDIHYYSNVTFEGNTTLLCNNNNADYGGAVYIKDSNVTFEGNLTLTFDNNSAKRNGGAIDIYYYSNITFKGKLTVTFNNNNADNDGGALYIHHYSNVTFEGNSTATFNNNDADMVGGAVYIESYCNVTFAGNLIITFYNNKYGALIIDSYSSIIFEGNLTVTFNNNSGNYTGGAVDVYASSNVTVKGNSIVTFYNNSAKSGGAIYISYQCNVTFQENSTATFNNNNGGEFGGAVSNAGSFICEENSTLNFYNNCGKYDGGAIYTFGFSIAIFKGKSTATFNYNSANNNGGAVAIYGSSTVIFEGNTTVSFIYNTAKYDGAAVYSNKYAIITFEGSSTVTFNNNKAYSDGGAVFIHDHCIVTIKGNSSVSFELSTADGNGGAIYIDQLSLIRCEENPTVTFTNNMATNGGAMYVDHSAIQFEGNNMMTFYNNNSNYSNIAVTKSSQNNTDRISSVKFTSNLAFQDGGAICLSDHSNFMHSKGLIVSFDNNTAVDYGGAIYALFENSIINLNSSDIYFKDNTAGKIHKSIFIYVSKSCNSSCLFHNVNIINTKYISLATSPSKLILRSPAKCINGSDTDCVAYYMNNIMLGQEIIFEACVLDYYDQPTEAVEFSVTGMNHEDYHISGSQYISVSCNHTIQGISINGSLHSNSSYNYSVFISMYFVHISKSKLISVNIVVEISQCHLGFWHSSRSQICECFNTKNIISCPGSNSTIKKNYWFGIVSGKPTVASCPNNYCDFTCCQITNGIYHLSPIRANQCKPHRLGTACGNCQKGYTLSFDSPDCVEVNKCTVGHTVLVITLSMLYWIGIVVAVFAMMHFKVTIGSLHAIIYYYSVVDILLGQVLFISNGLYTAVNIFSSLAKLTPKFLGQLCLVKNMSGIDQYFIHYVHPAVVLFMLIMITVLSRRSRRVSLFVSRGVVYFVCFLLLLSYTSVVTTSLLLMRPLKFTDIDEVYTYLSPDIEYCHGRHLVYMIVAMISTLAVVIGLPLLLLLEPFLNSKINFIKIKPLLDQFQCCYKDKYRCFAGYYMICRLVIILLVIINILNEFTTQYLLISSCAIMELIHVLVRPYASTFLNVFDGVTLQLISIISALPLVEYVGNYNETLVLLITCLLLMWPLASYIVVKLWIYRSNIQNAIKHLTKKCSNEYQYSPVPTDDDNEPNEINEFNIVVDDNTRRNVPTFLVDM